MNRIFPVESAHLITFEEEYWAGNEVLRNEIPWLVPSSVYFLDHLVTRESTVLDLGSGGSTLFFARRAQGVVAIETHPESASIVAATLHKKQITNVGYFLEETQDAVEALVRNLGPKFSIVSVDTLLGYDRSRLLNLCTRPEALPHLRTIIMDNYANSDLFPLHYAMSISELLSTFPRDPSGAVWKGKDFNDFHWIGNGTRILYRE